MLLVTVNLRVISIVSPLLLALNSPYCLPIMLQAISPIVQRIPVKVVFDAERIKGYESRIAPGMPATVNVELK